MSKVPEWAKGPWDSEDNLEPGVIVRPNEDQTIDEIVIDLGNGAHFHLEQTCVGQYWIGVNWTDPEGRERMQQITLETPRGSPIYPQIAK